MLNFLLTLSAKTISKFSQTFNLGNGSTWPGHIALGINPHIIQDLLENSPTKIILIVGTNGKTTTSRILTTILKENGSQVIQNTSGANLLNGIASSLILHSTILQHQNSYAVFEVDENNLPIVLEHITPTVIIALDLFRDQLDRYGELDSIAKKWNTAFQQLSDQTTLVLNADDPLIAFIGLNINNHHSGERGDSRIDSGQARMTPHIIYFGLSSRETGQKNQEHASDSIYCPNCSHKLMYKKIFYSHLGVWECSHCHFKRPVPDFFESIYPLPGTYNKYNTLAAVGAAQVLKIPQKIIHSALHKVTPAFGRQEKLTYKGKSIQIFLSKNPVSMNESLETIIDLTSKPSLALKKGEGQGEGSSSSARTLKPTVLFVLDDRIPDGRDISWIWDIAVEEYIQKFEKIIISGDRCYDMGLRVLYSMEFPISNFQFSNNKQIPKVQLYENLKKAVAKALDDLPKGETLYILPTYSAMLEVRKILAGKKIL